MKQAHMNGCDKFIQMDVIKLYKLIWQNYTNGCKKTKHMDLTRL